MSKVLFTRRGILAAGAGGVTLAGRILHSGPAWAETPLERARREKTIRVGFANEAPYAFASPDGKLVGVMPDVIRYVMADLGIPNLEGVLTDFGGLIPGLLAGRFDILGAGLYVTSVRCGQA